ncbi:MAG: ABC transporter substrate-binding protein [Candidatus Binatia bacterium]
MNKKGIGHGAKAERIRNMRGSKKKIAAIFFLFLCLLVTRSAMAASPALLKAKQSAEAKGFIFETSHEEIVAKAKREGKLRVLSSLDPETYKQMGAAFKQKYPFIDFSLSAVDGTEAVQRLLLELKAGSARNWDTIHLSRDFYNEFAEFVKKIDVMGMGEHGVLAIPTGMIDPSKRSIVAEASAIQAVVYNKDLISGERVPNTWEDFLKPEFKGRKFLVDIRPHGMVSLVAGLGEEWVRDYARKLKEQDPIWVRGYARALAAMSGGEYGLHQQANYQSCVEIADKHPTKSIVCKIIEPVPVRLIELQGVNVSAAHPYAGLLWLEFQATPTGQKIIDKYEPLKSSVFGPGSELAKVTQGRKLSIDKWDSFSRIPGWYDMIEKAFGLPQAEKLKGR